MTTGATVTGPANGDTPPRQLADADARRRTALDGVRIHPHPGPAPGGATRGDTNEDEHGAPTVHRLQALISEKGAGPQPEPPEHGGQANTAAAAQTTATGAEDAWDGTTEVASSGDEDAPGGSTAGQSQTDAAPDAARAAEPPTHEQKGPAARGGLAPQPADEGEPRHPRGTDAATDEQGAREPPPRTHTQHKQRQRCPPWEGDARGGGSFVPRPEDLDDVPEARS
eukprot:scaffold47791_cov52-Phaeocystis_antarctica.AAC.1